MILNIVKPLVLMALAISVHAQYRLDTWTTDNGLPQNSVTGLTQTKDEYLWFTTNDGLVRFDGNRFKVFNKSTTTQITSNRLSAAFTDELGRLWFQAEDGSILYYEKGSFTAVAPPGKLPMGSRTRFFADGSGVVFNIDLQPYHLDGGQFVPMAIPGLPRNTPVILSDRRGGIWFHGSDAIYCYADGRLTSHSTEGIFTTADYRVAYEDRNGSVWAGFFADDKFSLLRIKDGRVIEIPLPQDPVAQFAEDAEGNLWLSIYTQGIFRIDRAAATADEVPGDAIRPVAVMEGMSTNSSGHLVFDREGGLWVGTEKGLNRISPQIVSVFSRKDGLKEENVYPLLTDSRGRIWAGVWPNNLVKYEDEKFQTRISNETVFVTSLFEDSRNRLWFGTIGGLFYLENDKPVEFTGRTGFADGTEFSATEETADGSLWFGTSRGLGRYSGETATIFTTADGLPDDYVVALLRSRDGKLWIGTRGGLASYENGRFNTFTVPDGLASNSVRSLYEDAEGVLWIGSYDGGLTRLKDGRFTVYTMRDGLSSNGVFCILEDESGWFWMNSNQGIYRVSRTELNDFADGKIGSLNSISYNQKDGLLNVEGNGGRQPAGTKSADGRLWFPTAGGIAVIDPKAVTLNRIPPPVLIEEVLIDRSSVPNDAFQDAVSHRSNITLEPGQSNLEINYTALSYVNSGQLKFRYKLEGLDAEWNNVGTRRTAYYSYLPPGDYVFRVIAANRDGVWNDAGASIAVTVLPPFYRTWWFVMFVFLTFAGVILLAFLMRVRVLHQRAEQQTEFTRQLIASQEIERGRIAAEMHDGLGQSLAIIKNRALISLSKPDDHARALEQLEEIAEASSEALNEVQGIIYDLRPVQLDRLGLTGAIEDMAGRVCRISSLGLSKSVDNIDDIFPKQSENSVYRIVQETLNNIVKHSRASRVELTVTRERSLVRITVKDDGVGFDPARSGTGERKGGFGLSGMSERAKLLGGKTVVESSANTGTRVSVVLPF